ncbi:MAG TPA: DUF6526 family protein [Bryobacteraceae bacterium]|nr:DUF6526 family protein [Bryobacteraceae bacterium]
MSKEPQSLQNHVRLDPSFHFLMAPAAFILLIAGIVNVILDPGWRGAALLLAAIWCVVATLKIRLYALKVQDRVIRLEERLRLKELLPLAAQSRISELNEAQLIALRFASDVEIPDLFEKTVEGQWDGKRIKQSVQNWRGDYWRV